MSPGSAPLRSRRHFWSTAYDYALTTAGGLLLAVNLNLFLAPAKIAPGGVSGSAIIINEFTGWPIGLTMLVLNVPMIVLGFLYLGRFAFLARTLYAVLVYNLGVDLLAPWLPAAGITDDMLLNALYGGIVAGLGTGLVYRSGGTTAGTGTLSRVIQMKTGIPISQVYFLTDGGVILIAGLVFGWEAALYAMITLFVWGLAADYVLEGPSVVRMAFIVTDEPGAVAHALDVFRHDLDPENHRDIVRWAAEHPTYGAPPPEFVPDYTSGGTAYQVQFPEPLTVAGQFSFEMVQSPDNSLRDPDSLLGMVARAGAGDTVLVQQLYEYTYWGPTAGNPQSDPNVRLEAYIDAARRGAHVRIMLDSAWDDPGDPRGNTATCAYVTGIAQAEGLNLGCSLADPAGTGIHNKMVLVHAGGRGYVHTGSINGSENSSKNNREFAVQVQSDAAYAYLARVFLTDDGRPPRPWARACSTGPRSSSAAIWGTPAVTATATCRSSSPAAAGPNWGAGWSVKGSGASGT